MVASLGVQLAMQMVDNWVFWKVVMMEVKMDEMMAEKMVV
jgi:hypothetical protein